MQRSHRLLHQAHQRLVVHQQLVPRHKKVNITLRRRAFELRKHGKSSSTNTTLTKNTEKATNTSNENVNRGETRFSNEDVEATNENEFCDESDHCENNDNDDTEGYENSNNVDEFWQASIELAQMLDEDSGIKVDEIIVEKTSDSSAKSELEWLAMTVVQLKDELRSRGLKISGKKAELVKRLIEDDTSS